MDLKVDELLSALSLAVDLSIKNSLNHSKITAYISFKICEELKLSDNLKNNIYCAAFLHDIGIGTMSNDITLIDIHKNKILQNDHCDKSYKILKMLPFDDELCDFVLYHHENFDGSGAKKKKENEIPLGSQIIALADYFDVNHRNNDISLIEKNKMINLIKNEKEKKFSSVIVDAFLNVLNIDKFWFDLYLNVNNSMLDLSDTYNIRSVNVFEIEKISEIFANIIDAKSTFTHEHSKGVANKAYNLSKILGYEEEKSIFLKISGYLHDLGKLAIPNEILDKTGQLSIDEYDLIKRHPYYTKCILSQVKCFKDNIARWAGNHHEKLDGRGYPEKLNYKTLSLEDQIIGVADIYQSLIENRPYRIGLSHEKTSKILKDMINNKGFDIIFLDAIEKLKIYL